MKIMQPDHSTGKGTDVGAIVVDFNFLDLPRRQRKNAIDAVDRDLDRASRAVGIAKPHFRRGRYHITGAGAAGLQYGAEARTASAKRAGIGVGLGAADFGVASSLHIHGTCSAFCGRLIGRLGLFGHRFFRTIEEEKRACGQKKHR